MLFEVRVIEYANFRGVVLKGIELPKYVAIKSCDFREADLSGSLLQSVDFQGSDFTKARMNDCHCEYSDFRKFAVMKHADIRGTHFNGALLQNVDFSGSDLRDAVLIDADMIGAILNGVEFYCARLLNTRLRKESFCNFLPVNPKRISVGDERSREKSGIELTPLRAKYVYSTLKNNFRSIGEYADERWAKSKERVMERKRLFRLGFLGDRYSDALALEHWLGDERNKLFESRPLAIMKWVYKWFVAFVGYCESPSRFLVMSIIAIVLFSFFFLFGGFEYTTGKESITIDHSLSSVLSEDHVLQDLKLSVYISVITFTTLGYGDAHPIGATLSVAAAEALLGFLAYSAFVATFLKRLSEQ